MDDSTTAKLALVISVAVALWELVKYLLEGGRVRVRMNPALVDDYRIRRSTRSWPNLKAAVVKEGGWYMEAVEVEIENISRSAVTLSDVNLDFGRSGRFRLGHHSIGPAPMKFGQGSTDSTVRLEPFDRVTYVFDAWSAIDAARESRTNLGMRPLRRMRASVRVAGKRWRTRSPWRKSWRILEGRRSFMDQDPPVHMVAFQSIMRWLGDRDEGTVDSRTISVALDIGKMYPVSGAAPTKEQIAELLAKHTSSQSRAKEKDVQDRYAAFRIAIDLQRCYPSSQSLSASAASTSPAPLGGADETS